MNKPSRVTKRLLIWFFLVFLVVLGLSLVGLPLFLANTQGFLRLKQTSLNITQPLFFPLTMLDHQTNHDLEVDKLTQAYLATQAQLHQLKQLKSENEALKKMLEVKDQPQGQVITTSIFSRTQPLVAAGEKSGIQTGNLVFVGDVFVGIVDQVWPQTASVRLLSQDNKLKILAKTDSGVSGLVKSEKGELIFSQVPANLVVKPHDLVFTSGQPNIPAGLLVGFVDQETPTTTQPTYAVKINPGVNFYQAKVVKIRP